MFISDPFLPGWQRYWAKQCLKIYPRKPNICNLDLHMSPEETKDLWEQSREQLRLKSPGKREIKSLLEKLRWVTLGYHYNWETKPVPLYLKLLGGWTSVQLPTNFGLTCLKSSETCLIYAAISTSMMPNYCNKAENLSLYSKYCRLEEMYKRHTETKAIPPQMSALSRTECFSPLASRMAAACMIYKMHCSNSLSLFRQHLLLSVSHEKKDQKYSPDHYTAFPTDLAYLSEQVAAACGFQQFKAEAGILNYYHFDSSLGIHVDESELDYSKPLLSFSFGQSAVFLLGGLKRQDPPLPMFIHSGDIVIMSGRSRLLYHAVPRVVPNLEGKAIPSCLEQTTTRNSCSDDTNYRQSGEGDWEICMKYLQNSRVNVTVRQVLGVGQSFPFESDTEKKADSKLYSYHQDSKENQHKRQKLINEEVAKSL
ncbi:nucleic acid dioxygenase ALKBH1 isoform X2 [Chiloscyllium plagiosum]|nr:nucleic acid dioxygenase ALKBH1 isoform X2 [Chiloscyllium plagiosum]XP_043552975.1 nucleic acid dioxygenase ALKBH1 isoform X2 [Chiloscyllium plagiosum]